MDLNKAEIRKAEIRLEAIEKKLENLIDVKKRLKAQISAYKKAKRDEAREYTKCNSKYYPALKGWKVVSGRFDGLTLSGTVLESESGKKIIKAHQDGRWSHIDLAKFSGKIADATGKVQRVYQNGQLIQ